MNQPPGGWAPQQPPQGPYGGQPPQPQQQGPYPQPYAPAPGYPPQQGAPYAPPAQPATPAVSPGLAAALKVFAKKTIFEHVGTVVELEQAFGILRALDTRNRSRRPLLGFGSAGCLLFFGWLGLVQQNPALWLAGIVGFIGCLVALSYHPVFEARRLEMASGLLRKLDVADATQVRAKLDLRPLQISVKGSSGGPKGPAGWSTSNYEDPWLDLEGTLASGIGFFFRRTDCLTSSVKVEVRGRTRTTYTNRTGTFTDGVVLRFPPQLFPQSASLGPEAARAIKLPEGMSVQHFSGQSGSLSLTLHAPFKWDAGPHKHQMFDAVTGAAVAFELASIFLDKGIVKPMRETESLPRDPGSKASLAQAGSGVPPWLIPAFLLLFSGLGFLAGTRGLIDYLEAGDRAEHTRAMAAKERDASRKKTLLATANETDGDATTYLIRACVGFPVGLGLLVAAGIVFMKKSKKSA